LSETQYKNIIKDYNALNSGVSDTVLRSLNWERDEGALPMRRKKYSRGINQLGSRCPTNPDRPKTSRPSSRPINITTIQTPIDALNSDRGYYVPGFQTQMVTKNEEKKQSCSKSSANGTEKCPRSIQRRPKSSRQFLVGNAIQKNLTKYRSDYFPQNKVSLII
jgi:hypothetical protein